MPKVLIFLGSADYTGACKMGHYLARGFRAEGHEVHCLCGERPSDGSPSVIDHLRNEGFIVHEARGFTRPLDLGLVKRTIGLVKQLKIELLVSMIQLDAKIACAVSFLTRIPCVVFGQSMTTFYGPPPVRWAKSIAYTFLLKTGADAVVCTSASVRQQYHGKHHFPIERMPVLASGIDVTQYLPDGPRAQLPRASAGVLRSLNVGRLDPQKGQLLLIDAVKALPSSSEIHLWLIGDATLGSPASVAYRASVYQAAGQSQISDKISFLGWRNDIPEHLRAVDAYIHAALWEGPPLPLAVLEAMACAKPVILTDCAGWPEGFVQGVHGFVVKANSAEALSAAILKVAKLSPKERALMGEAARQLVIERYDIAQIAKRFVRLSESVMNASRPPA